jgi:hypothetical protein
MLVLAHVVMVPAVQVMMMVPQSVVRSYIVQTLRVHIPAVQNLPFRLRHPQQLHEQAALLPLALLPLALGALRWKPECTRYSECAECWEAFMR